MTEQEIIPALGVPYLIITGANGWLGKRVAEAAAKGLPDVLLTTPRDLKITCLVAPDDPAPVLEGLGVRIVQGDIRDAGARAELLKDAAGALLIHLAGVIHPKKVSEWEEINTQATLELRDAAEKVGVARMIVMSSNSPCGNNPHPGHRFTEDSPYNPYMGYGRSKWKMEKGLKESIAAGRGPEVVIVRAPWFYGPGQPARQSLFFTMIRDGKFPIVGDGRNRRSMGYVDNLASGIFLAAANKAAAGDVFWLADGVPYSMNEIVDTVAAVLREDFGMAVSARRPRVPGIVGDAATLADYMLQTAGLYHQKIHVLSEMNKTIACEIAKAKSVLGYRPRVALREGMKRSVAWCLENGQKI